MARLITLRFLKKSKISIDNFIKVDVDLGYIGIDKYVDNAEILKKRIKLKFLTKEDKKSNKSLVRVIIEYINATIKTFQILK